MELLNDTELREILEQGRVPSTWHNPTPTNRSRALRFIPLEALREGPTSGYVQVFTDYWWSVHPVLGAIMAGFSAQCNQNPDINQKIGQSLYPGAQSLFIHKAFVPVRLNDLM